MSESVSFTINVVDDEACPSCGAYWGNPDESLDFANRPKYADANGVWWWRCYNPACSRGYYLPHRNYSPGVNS